MRKATRKHSKFSIHCEAFTHQVGTVASQQTGLFQTVVDVFIAVSSHPAVLAPAGVATLGQGQARRPVTAGVALLAARVLCHVALFPLESVATQALKVVGSGQVLAHGPVGTDALCAVGDLILALQPGESLGTVTPVALGQVHALGTVEAGPGGALVNVNLAILAGEAGRAVALWAVLDGDTQATVLAEVVVTGDGLAVVLGDGSGADRLLTGLALVALPLSGQGLEVVGRAGGAGGQASGGECPGEHFSWHWLGSLVPGWKVNMPSGQLAHSLNPSSGGSREKLSRGHSRHGTRPVGL